ncbi:hypothetical protein QTH90_03540 [Variovorax sp. J2P1-59]|uniref:hypothetical protein n=1 Tax=Variovorax flavidus TaxID=3053501 RepID=UPI0025761B5F|nr:hypothetical protein [Variovorax sp. J2P1-59]MDM0073438.1 hypothetical protein [Variovorax sp. J2P1-59]
MNTKAIALCWIVAAISAGFAGCHEKSDGDSARTAPSASTPSSSPHKGDSTPAKAAVVVPRTYAIARVVNAQTAGNTPMEGTTKATLFVVDTGGPAAASKAIELGTLPVSMFGPPNAITTQAFTVDRATRSYTYDGEAMAVFVKDGKVFKIDLRSDLSHEPVQISSLSTACRLSFDLESLRVSADGRDAWIKIDTQDAKGSCDLSPNAADLAARRTVFVRSTMSTTTPPLADLPGKYVDALDDGALTTLAFVLSTPEGLELFRPDFSRIGKVEGGSAVRSIQPMGYDYSTLQAGYYRVDGKLRRLAWTATTATLAEPTYAFTRPDFGQRNPTGHADKEGFYFGDGDKLMKVSGAGTPSTIATVAAPPIYAIFVSDTHLALWHADPAQPRAPNAASVIGKDGNGAFTIRAASALGTSLNRMIYRAGAITHAVKFDGKDDIVLGAHPEREAVVFRRERVADRAPVGSYVACVPTADADKRCSNGKIIQTDLESLTPIEIGSLDHSGSHAAVSILFGTGTMGALFPAAPSIPTFVGYQVMFPRAQSGAASALTDLYTWTPGTARSLHRLTTQIQ